MGGAQDVAAPGDAQGEGERPSHTHTHPPLMHRKAVNSRKKSCVSTKTGFQPPELFLWKYNVPLGINRTHGCQEFSFLFFVPL